MNRTVPIECSAVTGELIPWLRVFVEGVVIVGSILLAFGISMKRTVDLVHDRLPSRGSSGGLADPPAGASRVQSCPSRLLRPKSGHRSSAVNSSEPQATRRRWPTGPSP